MNYDAELTRIIEAAKKDPDLHAKWRNKGIGRLDEAQALFAMGKRMTNLQPPAGSSENFMHMTDVTPEQILENSCTCTKHDGKITGKHKDCLVHGGWK